MTPPDSVILSEGRSPQSKDPDAFNPATPLEPFSTTTPKQTRHRAITFLTLTGLMLVCFTVQALGQGCAQCLDSTRATPPAVQAAYRHAILLLGGFGATLFTAGVLLLRRIR